MFDTLPKLLFNLFTRIAKLRLMNFAGVGGFSLMTNNPNSPTPIKAIERYKTT